MPSAKLRKETSRNGFMSSGNNLLKVTLPGRTVHKELMGVMSAASPRTPDGVAICTPKPQERPPTENDPCRREPLPATSLPMWSNRVYARIGDVGTPSHLSVRSAPPHNSEASRASAFNQLIHRLPANAVGVLQNLLEMYHDFGHICVAVTCEYHQVLQESFKLREAVFEDLKADAQFAQFHKALRDLSFSRLQLLDYGPKSAVWRKWNRQRANLPTDLYRV